MPKPNLSRRDILAGLAASTVTGLFPDTANAALQCQWQGQKKICTSGLPSHLIHISAVENTQYQSQWCWAACIAMVFKYYGHPVSQKRIVQEGYGGIVNLPAQPWRILHLLNRQWTDDYGRPFQSMASYGVQDVATMSIDLSNNYPLIIGTQGHAMLLTAMTYSAHLVPTNWGPQLSHSSMEEVIVRDPWPGKGRRSLSASEWYQLAFATQIRVG